MSVTLKSDREIALMRRAGQIVAQTLQEVRNAVRPGVSTRDLDRIVERAIRSRGAEPSFPYINDFPGSACVSVNSEVVHGIPGKRVLHEGDIVKIDVGATCEGYHGDAAITVPVGTVSAEAMHLIEVTEQSLAVGIAAAQAGSFLNDIGSAIQEYVEPHGFSVVRQYVGHGVGRELHEEPSVAHFRQPTRGMRLRSGMTITIEPMINAGSYDTRVLDDEWTVVTVDGHLSAQFEHTIAITEHGPEILTLPPDGYMWGIPLENAKQVH